MSKRQIDSKSFERSLKPKLSSGYKFASSLARDLHAPYPAYTIDIRQHAENARVCSFKEKVDRRPIDPPPIIQLYTSEDDKSEFLQSTGFFMTATLIHLHGGLDEVYSQRKVRAAAGITVQTPTKLKDENGKDGLFCIWNHLSVRQEGQFKLYFRLFERRNLDVVDVASAISNIFTVHNPKNFPGMSQSSYLTRCLASQGVRIRVRNDNKAISKKIQYKKGNSPSDSLSSTSLSTSSSTLSIPSSSNHQVFNRVQQEQPHSNSQQLPLPKILLRSLDTSPMVPTPLHQSYLPFTNTNADFTGPNNGSDRISQLPRPLPPEGGVAMLADPLNSVDQLNQHHHELQQQQSKANIFQLLDAARTLNEDEERGEREERARRAQPEQ